MWVNATLFFGTPCHGDYHCQEKIKLLPTLETETLECFGGRGKLCSTERKPHVIYFERVAYVAKETVSILLGHGPQRPRIHWTGCVLFTLLSRINR